MTLSRHIWVRAVLAAALGMVGLVLGFLAWFDLDTRGLPDAASVAVYAPRVESQVVDPCTHATSVVIPYESIGDNLHLALEARGTKPNGPGALRSLLEDFAGVSAHQEAPLSAQLARTLICDDREQLVREIDEIRLAAQLERHFSQEELLTIYVNRLHLGGGIIGIQTSARHYFDKDPNQLSLSEAATIAAMISSPNYFSPAKHSDRAQAERNRIIDAMAFQRLISVDAAILAKNEPLVVSSH